jgi:hypothetical protein
MNEIFWFVTGAISSFFINLLTEALFPRIRLRYRLWATQRKAKKSTVVTSSRKKLSVGGFAVDWIVLSSNSFTPNRIRCFYDDHHIPLTPEFDRMKKDFVRDWKRKLATGETRLPYNGPTYKLKAFDIGYREIIDGEEVAVLVLKFGPTDYFTQLVTDLNINNPIRERYAAANDLTVQPVPEFSSVLGINLNLFTKDGYLIVTERDPQIQIAAGKLHTSVAEGLLRPTDTGLQGAPDPFRCALRGAEEEIGVVLPSDGIVFTAFGVQSTLCQYSLIGWCQIEEKKADIENLYSLAVPKDKWENQTLFFVPCNPKAIAKFVIGNRDSWSPIGLAAVVLSLFQMGYDKIEIEKAFLQAQTNRP